MFHIVFLLLKIAGMILALFLALLILILVMPVRYSFHLKREEGKMPEGQVTVTWFFHLFYAKAVYIEKKTDYRVRVFGHQILGNQKEFLEKQKRKQDKRTEKERKQKEEKEENLRREDSASAPSASPSVEETKREEAAAASGTKEETSTKAAPLDVEEKVPNLQTKALKKDGGKVWEEEGQATEDKASREKNRDEKIKKETANTKNKEKKGFVFSIKSAIEKMKYIYREYHGEQLLSFIKKSIFNLIKHILPRRLKGRVRFGLNDPAQTGMLTGLAAMWYPKYHDTFSLEPDFQESCLEADCTGRGRIHPGYFVYILITVLLNRDIRRLFLHSMKK
ncbi:MAG: DUF2953 domain-containing protein [Eubacteriales bacterium]|nr:DUF2953 domain-containing protein [Eubacteriales bacterium]